MQHIVKGLFFLFAFAIGFFLVWRQSREKLHSEEAVFDVLILTLIAGFIGARISYIAINFSVFGLYPLNWIAFTVFPGFYLYGGIGFALLVLWILCRKKQLPFWEYFDHSALAFWIGFIIVLLSMFVTGAESGKESFISGVSHPVTLYKFVILLAFILPYLWHAKSASSLRRPKQHNPGIRALLFITILSGTIFVVDFTKIHSVYYGSLSIDQWASVCIFIASVTSLIYKSRKAIKDKLTKKREEVSCLNIQENCSNQLKSI